MQKLTLIFLAVVFLVSCQDEEPKPSIVSFAPISGNFGDQVTITGSNFEPEKIENEVRFGDVQAEVISATPTELVVIVPVGAKSNKISVKGPSGRTESSIDFTVTSGSWKKIADAPFIAERDGVVTFTIGQSAYFAMGQHTPEGGTTRAAALWQFNQTTGSWDPKKPIAIDYKQSTYAKGWACTNGKGYLIEPSGGKLYEYSPDANSWTEKAGLVNAEAYQYYMIDAFGIGSDGYVLLSNLKLYKYSSANNSWTTLSVTVPNNTVSVMATGEKAYFLAATPGLYEFTPGSSAMIERASPPVGIGINPEIAQGTNLSVFGGDTFNVGEFWEFNAAGNKWIQKASFIGEARYFTVNFFIGSKAYAGLGVKTTSDVFVHDVYEYSPE